MYKALYACLITLTISTETNAADFTRADLCKAAIAVEMGREVKTMKAGKPLGGDATISYVRADDKKSFRYKCRIEGDSIVWATYFDDEGRWGRWRNSYAEGDAKTTYEAEGNRLTINNDQAGQQSFLKSDF